MRDALFKFQSFGSSAALRTVAFGLLVCSLLVPALSAAEETAARVEARLWTTPDDIPSFYENQARTLQQADAPAAEILGARLAEIVRLRAAREDAQFDLLVAMMLVSPPRFFEDPAFRARVETFVLPRTLDAEIPRARREAVLRRLASLRGFDFDRVESLASAWDLAPRASSTRRAAADAGSVLGDLSAPIEASFFSFPPDLIGFEEAASFLQSVRAADPEREILVLTDPPLTERLASLDLKNLHLLPAWGVLYSPWPRDPMTFLRDEENLTLVLRPNAQATREADLDLGRAFVQTLPESLDEAWGGVRWRLSETPFHNGQVLFTKNRAWVSLHSLEVRILEILGVDRVPVEGFGEEIGERFLDAAAQAAEESSKLYGRPVHWVHDLPFGASAAERATSLGGLGGGAGFDLDSLVTLLPTEDGLVALVGDPRLGAELASREDLDPLRKIWSLTRAERLAAAQSTPRAAALKTFLDRIAEHLSREGLKVRRLPLLLVPYALSDRPPEGSDATDYVLGWNNVVPHERTAEGFASGWPAGDEIARRTFAEAGWELVLHPPLISSVIRGGGYRCASQHVRSDQSNSSSTSSTP